MSDWIFPRALALVATLLYGAGFGWALSYLARRHRYPRPGLVAWLAAGFAVQTAGLLARGFSTQTCPVGNPYETFQFISWSVVLLYLAVGPAFRMGLLGFFTGGLAAALSALALLVPGWDRPHSRIFGSSPTVEAHAALAVFSYGLFGLLALSALMYLLQHRSLRQKRARPLFSFLPSLVHMDLMNFRLLLLAVAVYSVAVALGAHYYRSFPAEVGPAKLLFTVALWGGYAGALGLRLTDRLRSVRLAWTCLALFAAALVVLYPVELSRRLHPSAENPPPASSR